MVPTFPGIDFDVFLAFNASYCYTKDEVIFENPILIEDVKENCCRMQPQLTVRCSVAKRRRMCGANGCDKDLADYFAIGKQ